jgi:hypothetical protein
MAQFKQKQKRKPPRDRNRVPRIIAIVIIFGLISALFIGSIGTVGAQAVTVKTESTDCVPDIDADGQLNAVDPDIDGDETVNGEDDDIDGDKIANFDDQDPLGTNCTANAPLPIKPSVVDNSSVLFIVLTAVGIAVAVPAAYFYARSRKNRSQ